MFFGYLEPSLAPLESGLGKISLADVFGVPFWIPALVVAVLFIALLGVLEKWRPWRQDLGEDYDGVPSGSRRSK
ncbi:MAG: hypothetical protein ACOC0U_03735 [Desulfovibrionales bacterium]